MYNISSNIYSISVSFPFNLKFLSGLYFTTSNSTLVNNNGLRYKTQFTINASQINDSKFAQP